jgi:hypothetical protein
MKYEDWNETITVLPKLNSKVLFKLRYGGQMEGTYATITDTKGRFGIILGDRGFISETGTPYDSRMDVSHWKYKPEGIKDVQSNVLGKT